MIDHVVSKSACPIRLTAERWTHISEEHCELAGLRAEVPETVLRPERFLLGGDEELDGEERGTGYFSGDVFGHPRWRSVNSRCPVRLSAMARH